MTNTTPTSQNIPTTTDEIEAFANAAMRLAGSALPFLKFGRDKRWTAGPDSEAVPEEQYYADVYGVQFGWVCWKEGQVVGEKMLPVRLNRPIDQVDLEDFGPYGDGEGWTECAAIQLRGLETGAEYIFKPTSLGGRKAIGSLVNNYKNRLAMGKRGVPIISLGDSYMTSRKFGKVPVPVLKVESWYEDSAPANGSDELEDEIPF